MITSIIIILAIVTLFQVIDIVLDISNVLSSCIIEQSSKTIYKSKILAKIGVLLVFTLLLFCCVTYNVVTNKDRKLQKDTVSYKLKVKGKNVILSKVECQRMKYDFAVCKRKKIGIVYIFDRNNFKVLKK